MPNGRSGGFLIERSELAKLLESLPATCPVGAPVVSAFRARSAGLPPVSCSAADVCVLLVAFTSERVWIEEQDHSYYVIHLDQPLDKTKRPDGNKWIIVEPDSPLFSAFRQKHEHYLIMAKSEDPSTKKWWEFWK